MPRRTAAVLAVSACGAAVLSIASAAWAQAPAASPPPAAFPGGIDVVTVDVVVTDKQGAPVTGLTRDDFTLREDDRAQSLASFEEIDVAPSPPAASPALRPFISSNASAGERSGRAFVIAFDDVHMTLEGGIRAQAAVEKFLRTGLREGDRLTLLATSGGAWWSTRLESGRQDAIAFVGRLQGQRPQNLSSEYMTDHEAMQIYVHRDEHVGGDVMKRWTEHGVIVDPFVNDKGGSKGQDLDVGAGQPLVRVRAAQVYAEASARNKITLRALERILGALGGSKDRKSVILLSEGFIQDPDLPEMARVVNASRRANAAVYFLDARGLTGLPDSQDASVGWAVDQRDYDTMLDRPLREAAGAESVAIDTGGFTVHNNNDIGDGLARIVGDSRAYYLLGYNPTNTRADGKFRKIKVEVKREGLSAHARRGYFAPREGAKPDPKPDALDPQVQQALDAPLANAGVPLRMTSYVMGPAVSAKAKVLVVAEADPGAFTFATRGERFETALETFVLVSARDTGESQHQERRLDLSLPAEVRAQLQKSWLPLVRELELAPGAYQARFVVRESGSGRIGSVVHDFAVPAIGGLQLSTPILTDIVQAAPGQAPSPVLVARRTFTAGAPVYCSFQIHGAARSPNGAPDVTMAMRLQRADGVSVGAMDRADVSPGPQGQLSGLLTLSLESADPGDYEVTLLVNDEISGKKVVRTERFSLVVGGAR